MKRPSRSSRTTTATEAASEAGRLPNGVVFALILCATLIAYFPALKGGYLWDDAGHVTSQELQSWSGLGRIWFEPGVTQQYYPLLHSAFWLEHLLWGDTPAGYHVVNVFWHALSAFLFITILRRLAVPGALLAGLVFALHPVCVESVAWISEQKNALSTVFALAALLAWLRFEEDRRPARYLIATLWFAAALLTKTVTATLPGALLVIAWWRRGRLSWLDDVRPLLPWWGLSVVAGVGTTWFEHTQIGAGGVDFSLGALERGLLAGRVVWFYFGKLLWPVELAFFYPRWTIDAAVTWQWLFPVAALILLGGLFWGRTHSRAPLAAALLYGGTLFPVLGFVNVYPFVFSYVADHFQYLASLGLIAFLAAAATRGWMKQAWPHWSGPAAATGLLLVLGILTWRQSGMYRDIFALYETTLMRNPVSWVAQLNYGTVLTDAGRAEEALPHLQRALELKPDHPETLNSLGDGLNRLGRAGEALPLLDRALALRPRFPEAHNTRAVALMALGRGAEGLAAFRRAVELAPQRTDMRVNLGWALANQGLVAEAGIQFGEAARQQPGSAKVELKWGVALAMHGRMSEAMPHLLRAADLEPDDPDKRYILGHALLTLGRRSEAVARFEEALRLDPSHAAAREALARIRAAR